MQQVLIGAYLAVAALAALALIAVLAVDARKCPDPVARLNVRRILVPTLYGALWLPLGLWVVADFVGALAFAAPWSRLKLALRGKTYWHQSGGS